MERALFSSFLAKPPIGDAGVLVEKDGDVKYLSIKLNPQMMRLITIIINKSLNKAEIEEGSWDVLKNGEQLFNNEAEWRRVCKQINIGIPSYELYAKAFASILYVAITQKKLTNPADVMTLWRAFLALTTCLCYSFSGSPDFTNQQTDEISEEISERIKNCLHSRWKSL
ncbi:MAG: hypothetical protein LBF26_03315 [Puniceicoccales bacterium]|jgi:hypothetical protein|nr:hypothetical protein [Puniceicoccales bacterium]